MPLRFRRSISVALALVIAAPAAANGQSLRDALNDLFVFGQGTDPLFLAGSAGEPATEVHGNHFIPAEIEANAAILDFFTNAISTNVASFPLSSTVASQTFTFVGGVPTPSSSSFGPIFAERAQTIGRGRLNAGITYSRLRFGRIRGTDLDEIRLNFVHENVDFPGCDEIFQADCSLWGNPQFENDVIELTLDLDIEAELFAFFTTFGVTDWLDIGVAVPVVELDFRGRSTARVNPTTGDEALHFFGGTTDNPILDSASQSDGRSTGVGDVAARIKAQWLRGEYWQMGTLAEVRAPTGREEDFLGSGEWNAKGLLILSGTFSDFSPHANIGYEYRGSELDQDELEIAVGFDHRMAEWATLAVDLLGAFEVGERVLLLPAPVQIEAPFARRIERTNLPDVRDDIIDGSVGFKFRTGGGLVLITNVLIPLNDGGLRAGAVPTLGIEYSL